jgi:hypothetical protein
MTKPDPLSNPADERASERLSRARDEIDAMFGPNHAKNNPHLLAMYMQNAANDYQAAVKARSDAQYLEEFSRLIDSLNKFRTNEFPMLLQVLAGKKP